MNKRKFLKIISLPVLGLNLFNVIFSNTFINKLNLKFIKKKNKKNFWILSDLD